MLARVLFFILNCSFALKSAPFSHLSCSVSGLCKKKTMSRYFNNQVCGAQVLKQRKKWLSHQRNIIRSNEFHVFFFFVFLFHFRVHICLAHCLYLFVCKMYFILFRKCECICIIYAMPPSPLTTWDYRRSVCASVNTSDVAHCSACILCMFRCFRFFPVPLFWRWVFDEL